MKYIFFPYKNYFSKKIEFKNFCRLLDYTCSIFKNENLNDKMLFYIFLFVFIRRNFFYR